VFLPYGLMKDMLPKQLGSCRLEGTVWIFFGSFRAVQIGRSPSESLYPQVLSSSTTPPLRSAKQARHNPVRAKSNMFHSCCKLSYVMFVHAKKKAEGQKGRTFSFFCFFAMGTMTECHIMYVPLRLAANDLQLRLDACPPTLVQFGVM